MKLNLDLQFLLMKLYSKFTPNHNKQKFWMTDNLAMNIVVPFGFTGIYM